MGKRQRSQASQDAGSMGKLRRILELVPSDRALQDMDAVRVFSQLSELRDTFGCLTAFSPSPLRTPRCARTQTPRASSC